MVPGFRWHQIADEALNRTVPLDRIDSFGVCGNGGGRLIHDQVFGETGSSGCIDLEAGRALIYLDMFSEESEFALFDAKKSGLTFIKVPREFRPSAMALSGDKIVYTRGDGWAAVSDLNGKILKKRQVRAAIVATIG